MNTFWVILIIIVVAIILLILFFLFIVWGISKGIRNKFGPEWIPAELRIMFNHIDVDLEDRRVIKYLLSDYDAREITFQINSQINNENPHIIEELEHNRNSFPQRFPESFWRKINDKTYEFWQVDSNKLKATFSTMNNELIYYK